jgi:hypothetical protein
MPTWVDIDRYKVKQLMNADGLNTLRDNMEYLLQPNFAEYHHPGTGGDYTVTDETAVDLDSTNFNLTITTYGGPVLATFYGMVDGSASNTSIRLSIIHVDTLSYIGRNLFHNFLWEYQRTANRSIGGLARFDGLPSGSHSFKVIWGASGGTGTMDVSYRPRFCVIGW